MPWCCSTVSTSLILISHIKYGVEIARANKLGQVIIDTIRQHHGTSLIKYFYEKARKKKGEDSVNIDDFRYVGPKPQTREAGLVMLADVLSNAYQQAQLDMGEFSPDTISVGDLFAGALIPGP